MSGVHVINDYSELLKQNGGAKVGKLNDFCLRFLDVPMCFCQN
jgi:hypothetical protein